MAAIQVDNLTRWSTVQSMLGLPDSVEAQLVTYLIPEVSAAIAERLGRRVLLLGNPANPITEYYSGKGGIWLLVRHRPIYTPILTGDTIAGSAIVTNLAGGQGVTAQGQSSPTTWLFAGQPVTSAALPVPPFESTMTYPSGSNVAPPNTFIQSIDSATQVTLTQNATSTTTAVPLYFGMNAWEDDNGYWGQVAGSFNAASQLSWGSDFAVRVDEPDGTSRSGMLLRLNDVWNTQYLRPSANISQLQALGMGNVKVQYMAGWPSVPADIELAAVRTIAKIRNSRLYGDMLKSESKSEPGGSYNYSTDKFRSLINLGLLDGDVGPFIARYANAGLGDDCQ